MKLLKHARYKAHGGVTIAADIGGDPAHQPVILLHGGGQTRFSWGKAAEALILAGYYAISMDSRGHGQSDWSPEGDYSMDSQSADLRAVIATLQAPPALVGASMGGICALVTAGEHPGLARALILVDVVPRIDIAGAAKIHGFMTAYPEGFATVEEAADAVAKYLPHRPRPKDISGLKKNLRQGEDGRLYWHWDPKFMATRDIGRRVMDATRLEDAARSLRIPTLLVRGNKSEIVSEEGVREFLKVLPSASFIDVAGAGHMVAGDRNDAFNEAIIAFLKANAPAGSAGAGGSSTQ